MKYLSSLFLFCFLAGALLPAAATVKVITSTTDFAAITREVGGDRIEVESLATGDQDLHHVDPRPSFVAKLSQADMVVRIGMDLDLWMDSLLNAARNSKVAEGGPGYVDASNGIKALEVPTGKVDGSKGDIHVYGNPHYWLDPENGKVIAFNILHGLARVDPDGAETYKKNYESFLKKIDEKMKQWQKDMKPLLSTKMVTYHTTWSYFFQRFGLVMVGTIESKPGIPPSGSYIGKLIRNMKHNGVKTVMTTSYYPSRFTDLIHKETGATILVLPTSVGGVKDATDYLTLFDATITAIRGVK